MEVKKRILIQKTQCKDQRQSNLLRFRKLDIPHSRNWHQPNRKVADDIDNFVADSELLKVQTSPLRRPEGANRLAVENGEESHDNCPHRDQNDHAVDNSQETRMLENASV